LRIVLKVWQNQIRSNKITLMSEQPASASTQSKVFWGELAASDHLVEIYADEAGFLESLAGFVGAGIRHGEGVIVIGTAVHLQAMRVRLATLGINLDLATYEDQYIPLDAEETLARFMVGGWPDAVRFRELVTSLLKRAGKNGRRVRAFGEMVAILWARGQNGATVCLEHLWNEFCREAGFCLFCAYPRSGFTQNAEISIKEICAAHSKVVANGSYLSEAY
jgi:hypothetical protein